MAKQTLLLLNSYESDIISETHNALISYTLHPSCHSGHWKGNFDNEHGNREGNKDQVCVEDRGHSDECEWSESRHCLLVSSHQLRWTSIVVATMKNSETLQFPFYFILSVLTFQNITWKNNSHSPMSSVYCTAIWASSANSCEFSSAIEIQYSIRRKVRTSAVFHLSEL